MSTAASGRSGSGRAILAWVQAADEAIDQRWEPLRGNPVADRIFFAATNAGEFSRIWHAAGSLQAMLSGNRRRGLGVSAVMGIESALVNGALKSLFRRVRPATAAENSSELHLRQPLTSSFPSGHASAAMCAATVLGHRRRTKPLYLAAAVIVASSRVHVRLHHPSDVVAGALVGRILGRIAVRVLDAFNAG